MTMMEGKDEEKMKKRKEERTGRGRDVVVLIRASLILSSCPGR
jgi:hypothetical protein